MLGLLLLLFVAAPVVDLFLLYRIGGEWGFWPTAALVVGTAAVGIRVLRVRGTRMLAGLGREVAAGRPPARRALDGLAIMGGAVLLIAPGPLTDVLGLALLLPPTRWLLLAVGRRSLERAVESGALRVSVLRWTPGEGPVASDAPLGLDPSKEIRLPPPNGGT